MLVALAYQFGFYSLIFVFSLFFQQFYGYTALEAGLAGGPLLLGRELQIDCHRCMYID